MDVFSMNGITLHLPSVPYHLPVPSPLRCWHHIPAQQSEEDHRVRSRVMSQDRGV
jgi:hypothetical protein